MAAKQRLQTELDSDAEGRGHNLSLSPQQNKDSLDEPAGERAGYVTSWSHLADELKRLDLLIKLQVLAQWKSHPADPLDQFKGLVVSDAEIALLLRRMAEAPEQRDNAEPTEPDTQEIIEALANLDAEIEGRRLASSPDEVYLALPHLSRVFNLSRFEELCLVICLAPELDRRYEKLYAWLQDDVTRKKPGVDLVLRLAASGPQERLAVRLAFQPQSPLLRYRLVHLLESAPEGRTPLLSRFLKLDDRIVDYLLGTSRIDGRLEGIASLVNGESGLADVLPEETRSRVLRLIGMHFEVAAESRPALVVQVNGADGSGRRALAQIGASEMGLPLLVMDAAKLLEGPLPMDELAWLAGREALLQPAALCFENLDALTGNESHKNSTDLLLEVAKECSWVTFFLGERPWKPGESEDLAFVTVDLPSPDDAERVRVWQRLASSLEIDAGVDFGELASKFRFTQGQIRDALLAARNATLWRPAGEREINRADLSAACRAQSGQKLNSLARKVTPVYTWNDIVLPDQVLRQMREICQRVVHRHRVMGEWGFGKKLALGKGVNALFAGPSGAGKTMAAEIIAQELDLDLYKIDLSGVVSKYIGETEKNLDRVFTAAQDANAILFFDEADALFGKRSEVRDSHDRYANIEISYLLQKMEEYEGVAILATNLKANLDESFTRRLAFTIHFPFPDEPSRLLIWKGIWPGAITLDESVDFEWMSHRFKLSGGNIKNIALGAAFLAASDGGSVTMSHMIHATRREYQKLGKPLTPGELGECS